MAQAVETTPPRWSVFRAWHCSECNGEFSTLKSESPPKECRLCWVKFEEPNAGEIPSAARG